MKKGSTDIHTLRTIWMNQIKATTIIPTGNLSRKQKRISGRAGRVAWSIMKIELSAMTRTMRHRRLPIGYGSSK